MSRAIDMVARRIGRLTVVARAEAVGNSGQVSWRCVCECGNETVVLGSNLRNRTTNSCGCMIIEAGRKRLTTHGLSNGVRGGKRVVGHPLYDTWSGIRGRCLRPSDHAYAKYGARGITMHPEWASDFL